MSNDYNSPLLTLGSYIYESPDNGKTVYRRKIGTFERVKIAEGSLPNRIKAHRVSQLRDMVELAETVPALKDQLEKLEQIYLLVKDENT